MCQPLVESADSAMHSHVCSARTGLGQRQRTAVQGGPCCLPGGSLGWGKDLPLGPPSRCVINRWRSINPERMLLLAPHLQYRPAPLAAGHMGFLRPPASPLPAGMSGTNVELRAGGWLCVQPKVDVVTLTGPRFLGPQAAMMILCGGCKSGQAMPGHPQASCRGSLKPPLVLGPRVEVATAIRQLSLSILLPGASTVIGHCPFPDPRGRKLICLLPRRVPSVGVPRQSSLLVRSGQCFCKECSLHLPEYP